MQTIKANCHSKVSESQIVTFFTKNKNSSMPVHHLELITKYT